MKLQDVGLGDKTINEIASVAKLSQREINDYKAHADYCSALKFISFMLRNHANAIQSIATRHMDELTIEDVIAEKYHRAQYDQMVAQQRQQYENIINKLIEQGLNPKGQFVPPPYEPLPSVPPEVTEQVRQNLLEIPPKLINYAEVLDLTVDLYCSSR